MLPSRFRHIRHVEATIADGPWPYAVDNRKAIDAAWAEWSKANPSLFNGRVLILTEGDADGEVFRGRYSPVDYAEFLHYMRLGAADGHTRNGFALAGLTSADDCLLMGVMGAHTANAGKIYFPGGTPDPSDIVDGRIDLDGSARRELAEETGLSPDEVAFEEGYWLYEDDKRLAFLKVVRSELDAEELRRSILERIGQQKEPELADIHILRTEADLEPERMPAFQLAYAEWWLAGGGRRA